MASALAAIMEAADAGRPLRPRDLRTFEAREVRKLFEAGRIKTTEMRVGTATEAVIVPLVRQSVPPAPEAPAVKQRAPAVNAEDEDAWTADEIDYLNLAYPAGVTFGQMARSLNRSGGEILQEAARRKLSRPKWDQSRWGSEIPAWRIHRLRAMLDEAQARGTNPLDDGVDLREHRALLRRFDKGRALAAAEVRHWRRWTEDEVAKLRQMRADEVAVAVIARKLHRKLSAVATKITELNLGIDVSWTLDEDRIIVAGVEQGRLYREIAAMLPGRSAKAVKCRAPRLVGPRGFDPWDEDEIYALRVAYQRGENLKEFAAGICRPVGGVRKKAGDLGLVHPNTPDEYTQAEDNRIRQGWRRRDRPIDIAADLGRTVGGIYNRAHKLGVTGPRPGGYRKPKVRRFEIEYIRVRAAEGWTQAEVGMVLRRSRSRIYQIAKKNGIRFKNKGPRPRAVK